MVRGLEHMPVAVSDLEGAQAAFRALGFTLKPGRPHTNGIRNAHVKFADGTYIELITAPAAVDDLTTEYRRFLSGGEGPAFLALYAPDPAALSARLSALHAGAEADGGFPPASPLHRFFFGDRQPSPTDRPEHFQHANTAFGLGAVWMAEAPAPRKLLADLGEGVKTGTVCAPFATRGVTVRFAEGEVVLAPVKRPASHEIIAATVRVRSLETARAALAKGGVTPQTLPCAPNSLWVSPRDALGLWLEMRLEHPSPGRR